MAERIHNPVKGQRYRWEGLVYRVTSVSTKHGWANIQVEGIGGWSKRQSLPLPAGSVLIGDEPAVVSAQPDGRYL